MTDSARRPGVGAVLAWGTILVAVLLTMLRQQHGADAVARQAADVQLNMLGRYAVGAKSLISGTDGSSGNLHALRHEIDNLPAGSEKDELCRAILTGELAGGEAALAALATDHSLKEDRAVLETIYTAGRDALDKGQRQRLIRDYGWFGKLALSYQQPADDALRRQVLSAARRAVLGALLATLAVVPGFLAGVTLLVLTIVFMVTGRLRRAYLPEPTGGSALVEGFAIYLGSMVGLSLLARLLFDEPPLWLNAALLLIVPLGMAWPMLRGQSWGQVCYALGWHRGRGVWREIGAGLWGYLAGLPLLAAGVLVTLLLSRWSGRQATHPIVGEVGGGWLSILLLFLLAAVWAPITEETFFRGALYHHLRGRCGWVVSAGITALLFAAIHPQGWTAIPPLMALAFTFATIREWRSSLIGPITAHALNNALLVGLLVLILGN